MKLRNKKTGEVIDVDFIYPETAEYFCRGYKLRDFIRDWEDYELQEPLIKDEKIRKAVRAWADACNLSHVTYKQASNEFYDANTRGAFAIRFTCIPIEVYLVDGEHYTIAELCGEEE